jgi:hypothetical protein
LRWLAILGIQDVAHVGGVRLVGDEDAQKAVIDGHVLRRPRDYLEPVLAPQVAVGLADDILLR